MDEIRIRELPQKGSSISLSDLIIVEDEDGTKTIEASAFKSLVQQSLFFDTVEDMKSATLNEGDIIRTLGYRSVGDGGGAYYVIKYAPTDIEDGVYVHYLHTSDTLRAHYIRTENDINISQAGAFGNGITDDFTIIQKMLNTGSMVAVPRRVYKVSGSLDVPSDTTIDLNGATILCPNSAAFCIGLDHEAKNITIKNGKFVGINGIELYTNASEVIITDCEFYGQEKSAMSKGIFINGASNVQIDNIKIGSADSEVKYGIYVSNGTGEDGNPHLNYNVQMSNLNIIASTVGIAFSGTFIDKNISVVDFSIEGYKYRDGKEMFGVLVGSNADSISLSNGKIKNMNVGICVSGIISAVVACTDIMVDDCDIMYNFASIDSTIHLYGLHRFTGNSTGTAYVFDRLTSRLVLQGQFDGDRETGKLAGICKTSMVGDLVDVVSPIGRNKVNVTSIEQLNDTDVTTTIIPGYKNISLNLEFSGTISELVFPSLSGQIVALYSDAAECKLTQSTKLRVPSDITLSRYEPVLLRNNNTIWEMIQFGGSSDGTIGGSTTGGTIESLEPLSVYFGKTNTKVCTYTGTSPKDVYVTPGNIGAAEAKHEHATSDIKGLAGMIPSTLPNKYPLKITLNGGTTEGVDSFTYTGSETININITSDGGGGSTVDMSAYGTKLNFSGSGNFSVNRKEFTEVGTNSIAMGTIPTATGDSAVAIGKEVTADGVSSVAIGQYNQASGEASTAKGSNTLATGRYSESSGKDTIANGEASFVIGTGTIASGNNQLVLGRYNVEDTTGDYVNIVGGGSGDANRRNIYTLDWDGNAVYRGTISAATPTADNHLVTKKYADDLNSNLDTRILEATKSVAEIKDGLKGFGKSGMVVTDWDNITCNGFVAATGALNGPPSQPYSMLMGIAIVNPAESAAQAGEDEGETEASAIEDGLVMVYSVADSFEYAINDNKVSFPVYMRQNIGGVWGEWYKLYIGQGDYDEAVIEEE